MQPIRFTCDATLPLQPRDIAAQILDVDRWTSFTGYGVLPGIRLAQFVVRTPEVVGSQIQVTNTDGSMHLEEIVEWQPESHIRLRMHGFSPPLSLLSREFHETWAFVPIGTETKATRSFGIIPRSFWTWPLLWLISCLLQRAIQKHLRQMRDS